MAFEITGTLIDDFDQLLLDRNLTYKASIIGGTAIMLIASRAVPTGDIDSILVLPPEIKDAIRDFAISHNIPMNWFNDNAARNHREFVRAGDNVFERVVYSGRALTLHCPCIKTLLLSKIYPVVDRPQNAKDIDDIRSLAEVKAFTIDDFDEALKAFQHDIRYENDSDIRKRSWAVVSLMNALKAELSRPAN